MEKYYIGGVASVKAFAKNSLGEIIHYFDAKTLTDSNIEISISSDEIRGGNGARLLGKFYHTSGVKLVLTDVCFNLKYLASMAGGEISRGVATKPVIEEVITGGRIFGVIPADGDLDTRELFQSAETEELFGVSDDSEKKCEVKLEDTFGSKQLIVGTNYRPKELMLFLKAKLFSGSCKSVSSGRRVGDITIEIPRFQPEGNIDLGITNNSTTNTTITGSALINDCGCGQQGWYSKITDVMLFDENKYKGYNSIVIANKNELYIGSSLSVYALGDGVNFKKMMPGEYIVSGSAVDERGIIVKVGEVRVTAVAFKAPTIVLEIG